MSHTRYIDVLGASGVADPGLLGGKGASLCRLVSLGHRVPARFIITRDAFVRISARNADDKSRHGGRDAKLGSHRYGRWRNYLSRRDRVARDRFWYRRASASRPSFAQQSAASR
jgi:phosphoenolpyruvate synthase/pyruvate phosphate dikinase